MGKNSVTVSFLELITSVHRCLKKYLPNIQVIITTVCLPFVLSSKSDVPEKVASSACSADQLQGPSLKIAFAPQHTGRAFCEPRKLKGIPQKLKGICRH